MRLAACGHDLRITSRCVGSELTEQSALPEAGLTDHADQGGRTAPE